MSAHSPTRVPVFVHNFHDSLARSSSVFSCKSRTSVHEHMDNKRAYGQRIREIEHGVFTPLVFSTTGHGGIGREATTFYKRLADLISCKRDKPYSVIMGWLRCKLFFAAVRSSILCIRGSRSSFNHPIRDFDITLASSEGGVPSV